MVVSSPVTCWCCVFLSALAIALTTNLIQAAAPIGLPGCPTRCGNLEIPYPFGIGSGCAFDSKFEIFCDTNFNPPNTVLTSGWGGPVLVYDISDLQIRIHGPLVVSVCYDSNGALSPMPFPFNFTFPQTMFLQRLNHYSFSHENKLTTVGCDDTLLISDGANDVSRCTSRCSNASQGPPVNGNCSGVGCCQLPLPKGLNKMYNISMVSAMNHTKVWSFNPCAHTFLGETSRFRFLGASDLSNPNFARRVFETVPVVIDWAMGDLNCKEAQNITEYACKANSHCVDSDTGFGGYRCICDHSYEGNPYLGCIDINECNDLKLNNCVKLCTNLPGSYSCSCPDGYSGDGKKNGSGCIIAAPILKFPSIKLFVGFGVGLLCLVVGVTWLYLFYKRRKIIKLGEKDFRRIGGKTLNQRITKIHDAMEPMKTFTAKELRKATDNYVNGRILGKGGHAIVYKGILPHDQLVAIKTPIKVDHTKIEDFINEVTILTQVKHRNVVKLLGCCLETEVPLLVYEYVSNGTLLEHIQKAGESSWLSWENRLRISIEIGSALAFLHSFAQVPIIHRDVKSSNILLDDNYSAKVSDFGISRLIPLDQTHKMTDGQGTVGYWDPEYFKTLKLTEKSDVYSYGIVLCELLTRLPVISTERSDLDINLGQYLINSMNKNCLIKILDHRILKEGALEQIQQVAELAKKCLHLNGTERPTMSQVVMELQGLTTSNSRNDNQSSETKLLTF